MNGSEEYETNPSQNPECGRLILNSVQYTQKYSLELAFETVCQVKDVPNALFVRASLLSPIQVRPRGVELRNTSSPPSKRDAPAP